MADNVEIAESKLQEVADSLKGIREKIENAGVETSALKIQHEKAWEDFEKKWDALNEARKAEAAEVETLKSQIAEYGAKLTKANSVDEGQATKAMLHKGMLEWARTGKHPVEQGPEMKSAYETEYKTLTVSNNAEGGVFVDPEFTLEIQKQIREFSPVRRLARVTTVQSGQFRVPRRSQFTTAEWTGEIATRPAGTEPRYDSKLIVTHEQTTTIPISRQLLDESAINFEQEIRLEGGEALGANEANGFTNGDGVGKPNGFLVDSEVSSQDTAVSNTLDADDLFDLAYDNLKTQHFNQAAWGMHRSWIKRVRKLKDQEGQYLLEFDGMKSLGVGSPLTLLGRPIVEMPDMPASTGTDGGKKAFVLANWQRFYWIVDSLGMTMIRDPFSAKGSGVVEFQLYSRTGGAVVLPEAGVILAIKA